MKRSLLHHSLFVLAALASAFCMQLSHATDDRAEEGGLIAATARR